MAGTVSSIVPVGFDAYAQILHPVETPHLRRHIGAVDRRRERGVAQVLTARSQWLAVAMPEHRPRQPRPWRSQGPAQGTLYLDDARALAAIAQCAFTDTPAAVLVLHLGRLRMVVKGFVRSCSVDTSNAPAPSPIPIEAKVWPKVHTRYRDYLLYEASLDTSFMEAIETLEGHSPNLWWPSDRAWCVGTEIDDRSDVRRRFDGPSSTQFSRATQLEAFEVDANDSLRCRIA